MKKLLLGLVGLVVLLIVVGFFLPRNVHVERSTVIDAPQSTVFALVNSYRRFNEWSPWQQIDPDGTTYTYSGPARGVGAHQAWESEHPDVGAGSQTITLSEPYSRVESELDFGAQGTAQAFFEISPEGDGTRVAWGFDSDLGMNPVFRYFGLVLDGMLGPQYEEGLQNLKAFAESLPAVDFAALEIETTEVEPQTFAYVSGTAEPNSEAISAALGDAYAQVGAFLGEHSLTPAGRPLAVDHNWNVTEGYVFDAGIPIEVAPAEAPPEDAPVQIGELPGGTVLKVVHTGPYTNLGETYRQVGAYIEAYGIEPAGPPWDVWVSDPGSTPEGDLVTHIFFPLSEGAK